MASDLDHATRVERHGDPYLARLSDDAVQLEVRLLKRGRRAIDRPRAWRGRYPPASGAT